MFHNTNHLESKHNIPYKKKHEYIAGYHYAKNSKLNATDYPKELFVYPEDSYDAVTDSFVEQDISYRVRNLPKRHFSAWDDKCSFKKHERHGHTYWKDFKKNKKQWMKNKPGHKDTIHKQEEILSDDPWEEVG